VVLIDVSGRGGFEAQPRRGLERLLPSWSEFGLGSDNEYYVNLRVASQSHPRRDPPHPTLMIVLAVSGSLRAASSNSQLLLALRSLAPPDVDLVIDTTLEHLPHFNPDRDTDPPHPAVARFRAALRSADAVVISSPEYAHGVPGSLKNALDWVVGSGELVGKPVALITPSSRGTYARASLIETLQTMSAVLVPEASIALEFRTNHVTSALITDDPVNSAALRTALDRLVQAHTAVRLA
jgi:chromate reductase, NAD(P)H dehydrogenase (quinone)